MTKQHTADSKSEPRKTEIPTDETELNQELRFPL